MNPISRESSKYLHIWFLAALGTKDPDYLFEEFTTSLYLKKNTAREIIIINKNHYFFLDLSLGAEGLVGCNRLSFLKRGPSAKRFRKHCVKIH